MVGYVSYQWVVGQDLAGLRIYVNLANLTETPFRGQSQNYWNAPA